MSVGPGTETQQAITGTRNRVIKEDPPNTQRTTTIVGISFRRIYMGFTNISFYGETIEVGKIVTVCLSRQ